MNDTTATVPAAWDHLYSTAIMQPTAWVVCGVIDHNFSAVLNWTGGISEIAGFLCSKCGEFRTPPRDPETGAVLR